MSDYAKRVEPNKLPPMKIDEVKARAQRILQHRGMAPYNRAEHFSTSDDKHFVTDDEIQLISDFVYYWMPLLEGIQSDT